MYNETLLPVVHVVPGPTLHAPAWQVSPSVHTLPSSQAVPSGCGPPEQIPELGLQVPAVWQASLAVQGVSHGCASREMFNSWTDHGLDEVPV